eukprot:CAMPEP_0194509960 /NCGR_PEP_ID=MMETSP0253-20130528/41235_1 /TAXON_ID=2966 /ORGANISM="Noctiluca scintillans" /LENGTH=171 /DNA_ID=CAMNT_0039353171 /DNA_START=354 /DNA_END=869 /DNA_ORIENTATION=-
MLHAHVPLSTVCPPVRPSEDALPRSAVASELSLVPRSIGPLHPRAAVEAAVSPLTNTLPSVIEQTIPMTVPTTSAEVSRVGASGESLTTSPRRSVLMPATVEAAAVVSNQRPVSVPLVVQPLPRVHSGFALDRSGWQLNKATQRAKAALFSPLAMRRFTIVIAAVIMCRDV